MAKSRADVTRGTEGRSPTNHNGRRGRASFPYGAASLAVSKARKDRVVVGGFVLAALPIVIASFPWIHSAFDAWLDLRPNLHLDFELLNLAWLALGVTAFLRWLSPKRKSCARRLSSLISLIFALALLFPVISANDDVAEFELINDATTSQSLARVVQSDKQLHSSLLLADTAQATRFAFYLFLTTESIWQPTSSSTVSTPGEATGNHSPPLS